MSNADNKTHGGKGVNVPTAQADKNYRDNFGDIDWSLDAHGKPRAAHAETLAFGDDDKAPLLQPNRCDHTNDMFGGDK